MRIYHVIEVPALDVGSCLPEHQADVTEYAPGILRGCCLDPLLIHGSNHALGRTIKSRGNHSGIELGSAVCQSGSSAVDSPALYQEEDAGG